MADRSAAPGGGGSSRAPSSGQYQYGYHELNPLSLPFQVLVDRAAVRRIDRLLGLLGLIGLGGGSIRVFSGGTCTIVCYVRE